MLFCICTRPDFSIINLGSINVSLYSNNNIGRENTLKFHRKGRSELQRNNRTEINSMRASPMDWIKEINRSTTHLHKEQSYTHSLLCWSQKPIKEFTWAYIRKTINQAGGLHQLHISSKYDQADVLQWEHTQKPVMKSNKMENVVIVVAIYRTRLESDYFKGL